MKYFEPFLLIIFAALRFPCGGTKVLPVQSSIAEVSLFPDGALVSRCGSVQVPTGKATLLFRDLPDEVDPSSLQVSLEDNNVALIRNAKIYQTSDSEENPVVEEIQGRLDNARKEHERQSRIKTNAREKIDFAKTMMGSFAKEFGKINQKGSQALDEARELAGFVSQTQSEAFSEIDSAEDELKAIENKMSKIGKELRKAKDSAGLLSSRAEVEVETESAAEIEFTLTYLVDSATWEPQYELRAYPKKRTLDFGYLAAIQQNTGEDWSNVTLSLHTNEVHRPGNVPELRPLHIRNEQGFVRSEGGEGFSTFSRSLKREYWANALSDVADVASFYANPEDSLLEQEITVAASTVSFQATIPGQASVLSSPKGKTFKVLEGVVEAEYWSESVPRLQLDAYLRAKFRNSLGIPVLSGNAIAFVDGKLSSKVHLDKILPGEEAKVSLGLDGNTIIKRTKGALKDSNTGYYMIGETKTLTREYISEVANLHNVEHRVVVVDQWPIAREDKIEIRRKEPKDTDTAVEIKDENNGIFRWNSTLAPKEKKTFVTAYDVVYPRDWGLSAEL